MADGAELADHLELVRALARRIHRRLPAHVELDELIGYGQLGLVEAMQRYRRDSGATFKTFAYYRIRGAIYDGIEQMVGVPQRLRIAAAKIAQGERLADETATEIVSAAAASGAAPAEVVPTAVGQTYAATLLRHLQQEVFGAEMIVDDTRPETGVENAEEARLVRQAVLTLPDDQQELLRALYFDAISMGDLAARTGVNKSTISRTHAKALAVLANELRRLARGGRP